VGVTALWPDLASAWLSDWPDLASAGVTALALSLGGAYGYEKIRDRARRRPTAAADVMDLYAEPGPGPRQPSGRSLLDQILASPPVSRPLPPVARPDPAPARVGEEEDEPWIADEMLTAPGTVVGQAIAASANLVVRTYQASSGHRWLQLAATAGVCLFLACLAFVLIIPLLLVAAFGYIGDSSHDIRLRIVMVLFVVDLALQAIGSL
jgi:hypothetical protein